VASAISVEHLDHGRFRAELLQAGQTPGTPARGFRISTANAVILSGVALAQVMWVGLLGYEVFRLLSFLR
jgi:hypothetical protein